MIDKYLIYKSDNSRLLIDKIGFYPSGEEKPQRTQRAQRNRRRGRLRRYAPRGKRKEGRGKREEERDLAKARWHKGTKVQRA